MMLMLKNGVKVGGLSPEMVVAALVAQEVYREAFTPLVITSAMEGNHGERSLHPRGKAIDVRIKNLPPGRAPEITAEIRKRLGEEYDVVLESDHIHIEFDPEP